MTYTLPDMNEAMQLRSPGRLQLKKVILERAGLTHKFMFAPASIIYVPSNSVSPPPNTLEIPVAALTFSKKQNGDRFLPCDHLMSGC